MKYTKKGQCMCFRCGSIVPAYATRFSDKGNVAKYLPKPSLSIRFSVSVFGRSIRAVDITAPVGFSGVDVQLKDPVFLNGCLDSFKADFFWWRDKQREAEHNIEVNSEMRVCPKCDDNAYLLPYAGEYDTYLVVELGRTGVGKTQFAKAISAPRFRVERDSFLDKGDSCSLLSGEDEDLSVAAVPTHLEQRGLKTFLVKRRGAEPVLIYLMDIAGEFLLQDKSRQQERAILKRILTNFCSAFFVFYDPREIASSQLDSYREKRRERDGDVDDHWKDPLPLIHELFCGDMPPVAHILTGLDTLLEYSEDAKDGWLRVGDRKAFSVNGALAARDSRAAITASSLRERMLLSRAAMLRLGLVSEDAGRNRNCGWFIVSSGKVDLTTNKVDLRYSHGVVEPLVWFLSLAGIAEVKEA